MLYYKNRREAGKILAEQLSVDKNPKTALIALGDGAIPVCLAITEKVPAVITMLITQAIALPGEKEMPIGFVDGEGTFVPNKLMSDIERQEYESEYFSYIEQEKREKLHQSIALSAGHDIFPHSKLHGYDIVMVSDSFNCGPLVDSIIDLLKPIRINKFPIAVPVVCGTTVERINRYSDNVQVLGVADNYLGASHYFEDASDVPSHEDAIKIIEKSIATWQF
jgi:putative phosphoribosyl transferase